MQISAALAADLRNLTDALGHVETGLESQLRRLMADIRPASRSYLGLALTIVSAGVGFTIVTVAESVVPPVVAASAALSLAALCDVEPGSTIEFYASQPGAFIHFAAELGSALGLTSDAVVLDQHLMPRPRSAGLDGLPASMGINQAIGVLIDHGRTVEQARAHLDHAADRDGRTLDAAAAQVIQDARNSSADD